MEDQPAHLTGREVEALADGTASAADKAAGGAHLVDCRVCLSEFLLTKEIQERWTNELEEPSVIRDIPPVARPTQAQPRRRRGVPAWRRVGAGAMAAAAVVALLWVVPRSLEHKSTAREVSAFVPSDLLRQAVQDYPGHGLWLPGAEPPTSDAGTVYRSGGPTEARTLLDELKKLGDIHAIQPSADADYWRAAGLLAAGQAVTAEYTIEEGRRQHPGDSRFLTLAAVLAYRANDLAEAERILDEAESLDRGNPLIRHNLKVVRSERSETAAD